MNGDEADYLNSQDDGDADDGITCKRCGIDGLHWDEDGPPWRLVDWGNRLHVCEKRKGIK